MKLKAGDIYAITTIALAVIVSGLLFTVWYKAHRKIELVFTAGQSGGTYAPLAKAIAHIIEKEHPRIRIKVIESQGSVENATRLKHKQADLALLQNDVMGSEAIRTLVPIHTGALHFIVPGDSPIQSLSDLEGKRIGIGGPQSGTYALIMKLLAHYKLDKSKMDLVTLSIEAACEQLQNQEIDALLMTIGLKSSSVESLINQRGVRFVNIGKSIHSGSEIAGFQLNYPFIEPMLIPKYIYAAPHGDTPGVPNEALPSIGVRTLLVCHRDLPPEIARLLTRTVIENRTALIRIHQAAAQISQTVHPNHLQWPVHRGADAYYRRNEPGFLVKYAEVMAFIMSLLIALLGLVASSRRWLEQKQKDRIDEFYLKLVNLLNQIRQDNLTNEQAIQIQKEIENIQSIALQQLAEERLRPDESFRIFQSLLHDCQRELDQAKACN